MWHDADADESGDINQLLNLAVNSPGYLNGPFRYNTLVPYAFIYYHHLYIYMKEKRYIQCTGCGYGWYTTSDHIFITCPNCQNKTREENHARRKCTNL